MKKLISILMLAVLVLSCFAGCGEQPQETQPVAIPGQMSNEEMYSHIDQTQPIDGIYKIWNVEGVKNIAAHPDAKFELLCNMDLEGAILAPIPEFTGEINGANFVITNFTVAGQDENFGFIGVNKGNIHNLLMENVVFQPGSAKNIGALAAVNEGTILRCTIGGTMDVTACAEGANIGSLVGTSTGKLQNSEVNVHLTVTAAQKANVGGIAGAINGGTTEYVTTNGSFVVTGENKTVGLFAGVAKDFHAQELAFVGSENSLDGKLVENYFGTQENVTFERMLVRDNNKPVLTEGQQKLRQRVVEEMYKMGTVQWHVTQTFSHSCTCTAAQCHGAFEPEYTQIGIPYNHKNGSWSRFLYCMDEREDGSYQFKDWVYGTDGYDGHDLYIGNDCSTAVLQAYLTVSNSIDFIRSSYTVPAMNLGWLPVGDWEWDLGYDMISTSHRQTVTYLQHNGPEVMYEAYAQLRKGDGLGQYSEQGGHNRMLSQDAVVVRDENGKVDPDFSYVLVHEQGPSSLDEVAKTYTTWRINFKYTFASLFGKDYIPITIEELVTGEMEKPECYLEGGVDGSRLGLTIGTVKANYSLDAVKMEVRDSKGDVVFEHVMFPTVTKRWDDSANDTLIRRVVMEYDLNGFATPLSKVVFQPGEEYHATITGCLSTYDQIVVKDFTFQS